VNKTDTSQRNFQNIQYTNTVLKFLVQIISFKVSDNSSISQEESRTLNWGHIILSFLLDNCIRAPDIGKLGQHWCQNVSLGKSISLWK